MNLIKDIPQAGQKNCLQLKSIQYTNPITYIIKALKGEDIQGSFYEPELSKAEQDVFRIDKVIERF